MKAAVIIILLAVSLILSEGCGRVQENNWPQFRGTHSLGIAPETATRPLGVTF